MRVFIVLVIVEIGRTIVFCHTVTISFKCVLSTAICWISDRAEYGPGALARLALVQCCAAMPSKDEDAFAETIIGAVPVGFALQSPEDVSIYAESGTFFETITSKIGPVEEAPFRAGA